MAPCSRMEHHKAGQATTFPCKGAQMTDAQPARPTRFRTGGLSPRKPTRFFWSPDGPTRDSLARDLGLLALRRLDFTGQIAPSGRDEMVLTASLTAECDQPCIVTLAPVRSKVTEEVRRRYVAGLETPTGEEMEMPEDDTTEPMPEVIDITEIAVEALMLALPLYPRAPGAELGSVVHAGDGVTPLADSDLKPFAGLAGLAERLGAKPKDDDGDKG